MNTSSALIITVACFTVIHKITASIACLMITISVILKIVAIIDTGQAIKLASAVCASLWDF